MLREGTCNETGRSADFRPKVSAAGGSFCADVTDADGHLPASPTVDELLDVTEGVDAVPEDPCDPSAGDVFSSLLLPSFSLLDSVERAPNKREIRSAVNLRINF